MIKQDRRKATRVSSFSGRSLPAEIRGSQNQSLSGTLLNISSHGALLELDRRQSTLLRIDDRVSVKLRLPKDIVWLAGIVRHCSASRLGVFFPSGVASLSSKANLSSRKARPLVRHHRAPQAVLQSL